VLLPLFAEQFNVGGPFLHRRPRPALYLLANLLDDIGIRQRRDVARVHVIGNRRQHASHDLAAARLRHVGHDVNRFRPRDFADHRLDR